jgi:adenylate cyclase
MATGKEQQGAAHAPALDETRNNASISPTARRRLVAVLSADVVGYSRLMEGDEEGTHRRFREMSSEVLVPALAALRGEIIKNTGDGFLAVFDSARDAAACAIDIQRAMGSDGKSETEQRSMRLRIGINVADVIVEESDIYGDGVNIAARLQSYAEPGGIVASAAVAEQIGADQGLRIVDLGDLYLRNLARPVRAYNIRYDGQAAASVGDMPMGWEGRPSVVVLPFREQQGEESGQYFGEGIVDDIIHALAGLRDIFVISRGSTLGFGSGPIDLRKIGRELGVRYVLRGAVSRSRDQLRITTELHDTETGTIVYSDQYDGEIGELFDLQSRIAARVARTIAPHIRERELTRAMRKHPQNMTAYELVLQALGPLYKMDYESFSHAGSLLHRAIALDPGYGPAYSYSAYWHMYRTGQGWSPSPDEDTAEAARKAEAAIDRDASDALAWAINGHVHAFLMRDYEAAEQIFERALEAGPNCAMAWTLSSVNCGYLGEGEKSVVRAEHGLRLSPLDSHVFWHEHCLAQAYYSNGNYDRAVALGRRALYHNPRVTSNLRCLAASLVAAGQIDEARDVIRQLTALEPGRGVSVFAKRTPLTGDVRQSFIERLRTAGLPD